jgi:site-specific recombinase XerD
MNALGDSNKTKRLIASMETVCEANGRTRVNGAIASERTFRMQIEVMKQFARTLHEKGYMVEDCANLSEKHVNAVFDAWVHKGLSAKTLQNQKSRVKHFFSWMKKPQLAHYVSEIESRYKEQMPKGFRVKTVAEESKSWRGAEVDLAELFRKAMTLDSRYAAMLMMARAFGLRKKEVLMIKVWKADKGDKLELVSNITKNGRSREVPMREGEYGQMQRQILEYAQSQCRRRESLGWQDVNFAQAEQRYYGLNRRLGLTKKDLGITGHGLRAGHAEDIMLLKNVLPATMGGTKEMSSATRRTAARYDASRTLGHNREVIASAYIGSESSKPKLNASLGHRFGKSFSGFGIEGEVVLWVTEKPEPVEGMPGQFSLPGVKAQLAYVTAQIVVDGKEVDRLNVKQLVRKHRGSFGETEERLLSIGLSLLAY